MALYKQQYSLFPMIAWDLDMTSASNRIYCYQSLPVAPSIVELCIHDNHKVGADVDSPAEVAGDHHDLHCSRGEQLLHHLTLQLRQTLMEVTHTIAKRLHQSLNNNNT